MNLAVSHRWDLPPAEARMLQARLAERVVAETTFEVADVSRVAGVDVSVHKGVARAAVVVLAFPTLEPLDYACGERPDVYPYVPGLLSFREGPSVLAAVEKLNLWPDLFVFDGHGVAHPRRIGLAAHLGVILDRPSIGCAKSRLIGTYQEPGETKGDWEPLYEGQEIIGAVVRSRTGVKPVFVSVGHRVDLLTAIDFVLRCTTHFRLPQTTRLAHQVAGGARLDIDESEATGAQAGSTVGSQQKPGDKHEC